MTIEQLKAYLPGWVKVQSKTGSQYTVYYLTGNVNLREIDRWVSADQEFLATIIGDRKGPNKFKMVSEFLAHKGQEIIAHEDWMKDRLEEFEPDTSFSRLILKYIFNNPGKLRD